MYTIFYIKRSIGMKKSPSYIIEFIFEFVIDSPNAALVY